MKLRRIKNVPLEIPGFQFSVFPQGFPRSAPTGKTLGMQYTRRQAVRGERQSGMQMQAAAFGPGLISANLSKPLALGKTVVVQIAAVLNTQHGSLPLHTAHGTFTVRPQDIGHRHRRFLRRVDQPVIALLEKPSAEAADYDRYLKVGMANTAAANAAWIRIVAGTDYLDLARGLHWELELLVKAGLSPLEASRTATSTAADVLGLKGQLGCISPGAIADLVVLEANPLEDIRNTQEIHAVIQGGRIIDRTALLAGSTC